MISARKVALFLATLLVAMCSLVVAQDRVPLAFGEKETHVWVHNRLPPGKNFVIHCKSRDNNLGVHVIGPTLQYGFNFHVNVGRSTLFFCGINTPYGQGVYDIYKASRDDGKRCHHCNWDVAVDGVYGYKEGHNLPDIFFKWTNK